MSNQTVSPGTYPAYLPTSPAPNATPDGNFSSDYADEIWANDLTSRANHVLALLSALALLSCGFLLLGFLRSVRGSQRLAWPDALLLPFSLSQLLLLALALSSLATRPGYLLTSRLGCAALAFFVSATTLCGLLLLVLLCYVLTFDPPAHPLLGRPGVCVAAVALVSGMAALLLAGLRGPGERLAEDEMCVVDVVVGGFSYTVAKLCLVFLLPYGLLLGILIGGCVHQWKSSGRFLSGSEEGPVFLAVAAVTFACQLFYFVVLVRGAEPEGLEGRSHQERALLSVAEAVMFAGSALCLVLVLLLHRPCRDVLQGALRRLRDCCRGLGGAQTHRHILAPRIEINDTQRHYE